jgi:hypothetical protein
VSESESVYDYMATETLGFTTKLAIRQAAMERERSKALGSLMGRLKYVSETESTAKGTEDTWSPDRVDILFDAGLMGVTDDEAELVGATDREIDEPLYVLTLAPGERLDVYTDQGRNDVAQQLGVPPERVIVILHGRALQRLP